MTCLEDIETAVGWIENNSFELPQTIRWGILKKFSIFSDKAAEKVAEERIKDSSLQGYLQFLYCEAAYPNIETKNKTWNLLTSQGSKIPKSQRLYMMKGFNQNSQKELLESFAFKYFYHLISISVTTDLEFSLDFTKNLFPQHLSSIQYHVENILNQISTTRGDIIIFLKQKLEAIKLNQ